MMFRLEIHNDERFIRRVDFPLKPQRFFCREQIEENDGTYGYLVEVWGDGDEKTREQIWLKPNPTY